MQTNQKRFFLWLMSLSLLFFGAFLSEVQAVNYQKNFPTGETYFFQEQEVNTGKKTGIYQVSYAIEEIEGKKYYVESGVLRSQDGTVEGTSKNQYSFETGVLLSHQREALSQKLLIQSSYLEGRGVTEATRDGEKKKEEYLLDQNTVTYEGLMLFFKQIAPIVDQKGETEFELYLPAVLFELPKIKMKIGGKEINELFQPVQLVAKKQRNLTVKTPKGKMEAIQFTVTPKMWLLQSLLPKYQVILSKKSPYYLIELDEGNKKRVWSK